MKLLLFFLLAFLTFNVLKAAKFIKGLTKPSNSHGKNEKEEKPYSNLDITDAEFKDVDD